MNFRQRIAWLSLAAYVGVSGLLVYYVFDVSEAWSAYAVDHVLQHHAADAGPRDGGAANSFWRRAPAAARAVVAAGALAHGKEEDEEVKGEEKDGGEEGRLSARLALLSHVADIPWLALVALCACLYLQTFFALHACTQPEPRLALALSWPARLRNFVRRLNGRGVSGHGGKLAHVLATVDCRSLGEAGQRSDVSIL